ncbi:MAG: MBL fold metallo-hydrolase [Bradyrhizobium sp.]|uniref:MBL fold metallo-hydrolase n=1 Tax=Bradyrhizobium sp. TaxID=376 RepID=UPI0029A155C8|nr:MBL fold metallo-hydrolase [Bradyrhizobium sp.]MDX3969225.1 MBL fold metallo-hydrolase [Bradyrhizobium sp.]
MTLRSLLVTASLAPVALMAMLVFSPAVATDLFSVTLLGTGSPVPLPNRNGPSTLVEVNGQKLLFDAGRNNTVALFRARIPLGTITATFLTHLHSDHVNGLPDLYLTGWIGVPFANRQSPFAVYGPSGTSAMMKNLYDAFSEDRRIRHADEHYSLSAAQVEAHDIEAGVVYERDGVKVTAFTVNHGELIKPAFGYKVEYSGHKIVLSGDTKYTSNVEQQGSGADVIIHEVAIVAGDTEAAINKNPVFREVLNHHTSPAEAGTLFKNARPRLAVFSHIVMIAPTFSVSDDEILRQARKTYDGPLVVGEDLMRIRVSDTEVSVERP